MAFLAWIYPALLIVSVYGTWGVAWLTLGHSPRPSIDDPSQIGTAVDVHSLMTRVFLISFPVAAICGVGIQFFIPGRRWLWRFVSAALLIIEWVLVVAFLRWDPLDVMEWFLD